MEKDLNTISKGVRLDSNGIKARAYRYKEKKILSSRDSFRASAVSCHAEKLTETLVRSC